MKRLLSTAVGALALLLPGAAFANLGPTTVTLNNGASLSLDTGTVGSGSGDILFTGTGISFVGSATGADLTSLSSTFSGSSGFTSITGTEGQTILSGFGSLFKSASIPLSGSNVNDIVGVKTTDGHYSAVLVNSVSSASLNITYFTYETGSGTSPVVTAVLNNYGLIPAGFSNSGIAPSTLFIIKGSNLADPTAQAVLQSATATGGLPTTLNGASVSVTVGSTTVHPAFYYAIASQLALVLPAATPTGNATVTVSYNGQASPAFNFTVVKSAPGIAASNGTGSGLAHAQDLDYNYYTYTNSIPPTATIRLIASGVGADDNPARDTSYVTPSGSDAVNALAHVYVGGIDSTIVYQGPEGYPGLDEIDVTIPANAPTGCFISIVGVTTAGVPTNFLTLPIGTGICQDTLGYNGTTLTQNGGMQTVNTGSVVMFQFTGPGENGGTTTTTEASADFQSYTGGTYAYEGGSAVSIGGCYVSEQLTGAASILQTSPLSAGTITVTSPNSVTPQTVQLTSLGSFDPGFYATINTTSGASTLPTGFLTEAGGTFTFNATAGSQVGSFTTQINFPNPLLTWTNQTAAATVMRSSGLPITWTGGAPGTYVFISGSSSNGTASGSFTCLAPVAAQSFTVPSYVLLTLPATGSNGSGDVAVGNETIPTSFTATGLNTGTAVGYVSYSVNSTYQ